VKQQVRRDIDAQRRDIRFRQDDPWLDMAASDDLQQPTRCHDCGECTGWTCHGDAHAYTPAAGAPAAPYSSVTAGLNPLPAVQMPISGEPSPGV
jgi:hypothetical protein